MSLLFHTLITPTHRQKSRALAFLPLPSFDDAPEWEWSLRYIRNEGAIPIIYGEDEEVHRYCLSHGISFLHGNDEVEVAKKGLHYHPADVIFFLSPKYPIRPCGLMRMLVSRYHSAEVASLSALDISLYDARTVLYTSSVSHFPSHLSIPMQNETISLLTREEVEKSSKCCNPFFTPEHIALIWDREEEMMESELEEIESCDLKFRVQDQIVTEGIECDATIGEGNTSTPWGIYFSLRPGVGNDYSSLCSEAYPYHALSFFSRAYLFVQILYPTAKIHYIKPRDWLSKQDARNFSLELAFLSSLSQEYNIARKQSPDESVSYLTRNSKQKHLNLNKVVIIHAYRRGVYERLIFDREIKRGKCSVREDEFTVLHYTPLKGLVIRYDNQDMGYYKCRPSVNVWDECSINALADQEESP